MDDDPNFFLYLYVIYYYLFIHSFLPNCTYGILIIYLLYQQCDVYLIKCLPEIDYQLDGKYLF